MPLRHLFKLNKAFSRVGRQFCTAAGAEGEAQINEKYTRRIFSGIQPTGSIHLGNYLGAVNRWVDLQNSGENCIFSIVDLHSITLPQEPKQLSKNILELTATLLACGIDPEKCILFQQSTVPQHCELSWQLGCLSTMARLFHLPQYKEKSSGLKDIPLGIFVYPVLQAADILVYKATHVPVGEDQVQQIQLAQDLARMFNNRFKQTFPIPHSLVGEDNGARLRSLREPTKKMSKSEPDAKSRICLTDSDNELLNKIKKAVTDFTSEVSYDLDSRPGVSNLINIHSSLTGKTPETICQESTNLNTGQYKIIVAEAVVEHLKPIRTRLLEYLDDPQYLLDVLAKGSEKAQEIAEVTIEEVRVNLGIRPKVRQKKNKLKSVV